MFNLFRSQGKSVKIMLGLLLFFVAASMLLYLVPQYGTDQTGSAATLLQVGDTKLTSADAMKQFQQAYQGKVPADQMATVFPIWFEEATQRYAVLETARQLGITTTTQEAVDALATFPSLASYFQDGKLTNPDAFQAAIAQQGYTPDSIFEEARKSITADKLEKAIAESVAVSNSEIEETYRRKNERASIDYVAFLDSDFGTQVKVSDEEVMARYQANKSNYTQPPKNTFRVVVLSQDAVLGKLTISEQELRSEYAKSIENFTLPEQVHVRHILLKTADKSDSDKQAIRKKAEDVLKQIRGGMDFEAAMMKYSEDTSSDLAPFRRGTLDKSFEDAAFALKPKEISGVVSDQFGFHIIQMLDRTPAKVTPFETARTEIEKVLRQEKLGETMDKTLSQLQADLRKEPANAATIAQRVGAEFISVPEGEPGAPLPVLGNVPEIDKVLPVLQPGNVSDPIYLPAERVGLVILDKRIPRRQSTFEEAKTEVRNTLTTETLARLVKDKANDAAKRLKAGEDIQSVAKALGTKVQSASSFTLTDSLPDLGPAAPLAEAFTKGPGTIIGPTLISARWVVAKVVSKTPADMTAFAGERKKLLKDLLQDRARENDMLWRDSLVQKLNKEGAIKVNQAEYQRILAQAQP